jgi:hypothetical protein
VLVDLGGQLAGRREHERRGDTPPLAGEPVKNRQQEGRRLSAPGDRAGQHVTTRHCGRDRVSLDGRWRGEVQIVEGAQQGGVKVQ